MGRTHKHWVFIFLLAALINCDKVDVKKKKASDAPTLFSLVPRTTTGIDFKNTVEQNIDFNYIEYVYAFNGAGVAIGDINNDGLEDIYFTSNQNSNKLYLNQGDFKFMDVTEKAGLEDSDGWTTGVSMVDINNDGWLDIYVCKSASLRNDELRKNKLSSIKKMELLKMKQSNGDWTKMASPCSPIFLITTKTGTWICIWSITVTILARAIP